MNWVLKYMRLIIFTSFERKGYNMTKTDLKYKNLDYILSVPDHFSEDESYPAIIFLHGAGGRGRDIKKIHTNPFFEITDKYELNAVVFAPQCYADTWFDIFEELQSFIRYVADIKYVNTDKIYLMGASMGGYATWQMAMTMPEMFAAIVPVCGGGMYWNAGRLKNVKVWAYHGSDDDTVFVEESKKMIDAIKKAGGDAKLTICGGVGHNSWLNAYGNRELFTWLFSQTRKSNMEFINGFDNQKQFG